MQPLASGTKGIGSASVESGAETVSCFSMSIARVVNKQKIVRYRGGIGLRTVTEFIKDDGNLLSMLLS